jgi:hypothetical protein
MKTARRGLRRAGTGLRRWYSGTRREPHTLRWCAPGSP